MTPIRDFRSSGYWARHPTRYCIHVLRAVWREIEGDKLEPWEQSLLIKQMAGILNEQSRPLSPSRLDARQVIEAARSFTDE